MLEALREIDSPGFAARVNAASDLATFLRAISMEASVVELRRCLRAELANVDCLTRKMRHLRDVEFDTQYENPKDTALAVFGWALATERPQLVGLASDLLGSLRNSWWAASLAKLYDSTQTQKRSETADVVLSVAQWGLGAYSWSRPTALDWSGVLSEAQGKLRIVDSWSQKPDVSTQALRANLGILDELDEFDLWLPEIEFSAQIADASQFPALNPEGEEKRRIDMATSSSGGTDMLYDLEFAE